MGLRCEDGTVAAVSAIAESSHFGNPRPRICVCRCNNVHKRTRAEARVYI